MPRRNPLTKLAAQAFSDQNPLYLKEMRKAQERYDFESAALALSEWTGRGHEEMRAHGLRVIAEYVRSQFNDARKALEWITRKNHRLGVWCACACARQALVNIPKNEDRPRKAIEAAESWVRGETKYVRQSSRVAWDASAEIYASAEDAYEVAAAVAAARAASMVIWRPESLDDIDDLDDYVVDKYFNVREAVASLAFSIARSEGIKFETAYARTLRDLVDVIVDAVITFPRKRGR